MDEVNHRKGVILSGFGVASSTGSMLVFPVAPSVKDFTNAGINVRNTPRLIDGNASVLAARGDETVHTTVKVTVLESVLAKESSNTLIVPISTATWPFDHDGTTVVNRMGGHILT